MDPPDNDHSEQQKQRHFLGQKRKYPVDEKRDLAKMVAKYKQIYDETIAKKKQYNPKTKTWTVPKPNYVSQAVRKFYPELKAKLAHDMDFRKAHSFAQRCFNQFEKAPQLEPIPNKRFRAPGGGRKARAPEVRDALFEWFIDIRGSLKGRLPKKLLIAKAKSLYENWLRQQVEEIPEDKKLKFGNHWVMDWMKEYGVSLKKPNKRYAIAQADRIERILDYLKNLLRIRKYYKDKFDVDPPIINGDQMPLHR